MEEQSEQLKEIFKKIEQLFEENTSLKEDLDRALKAWTEAAAERTNALLERDEYKIGHDRYEKLRRLNLQQIKELYLKNLRTGEHFDILVDKLN
jgi:hypothetical protein